MQNIRSKILVELLVSPWSIFPTVGGLSILMLAWALNILGGTFSFVGVLAILVGIGIAITNFTLNLSSFAKKAVEAIKAQKQEELDKRLDELDAKLVKDRDPRDQGYLRSLRAMHRDFTNDLDQGKIIVRGNVVEQVEEIFQTCINSLEECYNLWEGSLSLPAVAKTKMMNKREKILLEVGASVELLTATLLDVRTSQTDDGCKLASLREDFALKMEAARRTKERLNSLDINRQQDFSEYEK